MLGGLTVCAALKLLHLDELNVVLVLVTGLTGFLYLPAELVLVVALVRRRWLMAAVAAVLTTLHLTWVHGEMLAHDGGTVRAHGPAVTVVAANLFVNNAAGADLGHRLAGSRPDLVVLLEASPTSFAPLERTGLLELYPHRVLRIDRSSRGFAVLSRYPLTDVQVHVRDENWPFLEATLTVGTSRLHLLTVHAISPVSDRRAWRRQLAWLADRAAGAKGPRLLVGDLNATPFHHSFRRMLDRSRLEDAAVVAGTGWPMTWPVGGGWPARLPLPPVLQLDHVLVSPDVQVRSVRTIEVPGSDHRGLTAEIVLP